VSHTQPGEKHYAPHLEFDKTFLGCWLSAVIIGLAMIFTRHANLAVWADIFAAVTVSLLLIVAFQVPLLAGNFDLSVGGVAALSSVLALRAAGDSPTSLLLTGLLAGIVFGAAMGFAMPRFQRKTWIASGLAGMVALAMAGWAGAKVPIVTVEPFPDNSLARIICMSLPAAIVLLGLYLLIYHTPLGDRLLELRLPLRDSSHTKALRFAYLISGAFSGLAGACAGGQLGCAGATNAALFALSPLALILLTGGALNRRLARLENFLPAAFVYVGLIYLFGMPGWTSVGEGSTFVWQRLTTPMPLTDGVVGIGLALNLSLLLFCRDLLLRAVSVADVRTGEKVHYAGSASRRTWGRRLTNRQLLQRIAVLAAGLVLGLTFTAYSTMLHPRDTSSTARIYSAHGMVVVRPSPEAGWVGVEAEKELRAGAAVRTGEGSHVVIRMPGRNAVRLDADSQMRIGSLSNPTRNYHETKLFLLVGRLWADVRERLGGTENSMFEVRTPNAVAAVRGTQFSAQSAAKVSTFSVNRGFVEVSAGDKKVLINSGHKVAALREAGLSQPKRMTANDFVLWRQREEELGEALSLFSRQNMRDFAIGILGLLMLMGIVAETFYGRKTNGGNGQ